MPLRFRRTLFLALSACSIALELRAQPSVPNSPNEEIVQLPAFVLEGRRLETPEVPVHWYHAEIPGIEILSCLSAKDTARSLDTLRDQARLFGWILPPRLRPAVGRPLQLVLDARPYSALRMPLKFSPTTRNAAFGVGRPALIFLVGANDWASASYYLSDERASALVELEAERASLASAGPVFNAADTVFQQMPVPNWLRRFWGNQREVNYYADGSELVFKQFAWGLADKKLQLPSLAVSFANPKWKPSDPKSMTADARQAGLWFVRWALYDDRGSHREAFWNFVQANTLHPKVDEAMVKQNFGVSLAELDQQVGAFRKASQSNQNLRFKLPLGSAIPPVVIRDATEAEIGRMLGQWALLAWSENPRLSVQLSEAARRILTRANQRSGGDQNVTSLLGLVELDAGNADKARTLLESVAKFADLNSRARFEIAKFHYADALAKPAAPNGQFDARQLTEILSPLAPFRTQAPGESDPVALIALAWSHAATPPSRDELMEFFFVARQFPRDDQLLLQTALLCFQQNLNREATELVATILAITEKPDVRAAFLKLKAQIETRAREQTAPSN